MLIKQYFIIQIAIRKPLVLIEASSRGDGAKWLEVKRNRLYLK
jgi:hypothetical protein